VYAWGPVNVRAGKYLCDGFPVHNGQELGNALHTVLPNFVLEYAIMKMQVNQEGMKLSDLNQILVYADNVVLFRQNMNTVQRNAEIILEGSKEIDLELNIDTTKYMNMIRNWNEQQIFNMLITMYNTVFWECFKILSIWR